jgi:hypothetical protein
LIQDGTPRGRSKEEVDGFVRKSALKYFETSAKSGDGIEDIFQEIADTFIAKGDDSYSTGSVTIQPVKPGNGNYPEEKKKKCCE